jgi:K+/H+ antiporter YhaU regulatory subunit KhtT
VKRDNETPTGIPGPSQIIRVGDVVTAYGNEEHLKQIVAPAEASGRQPAMTTAQL